MEASYTERMTERTPSAASESATAPASDTAAASEPRRLQTGDTAPDFSLHDADGDVVSLTGLTCTPVILYFYPRAMTPGCTTEACDFRDSLASLQAHGYRVLGVSRDEPDRLRRFRDRDGLTFPLLSDPDLAVHRAYGAYGTKKLYGKTVEGVIRSTFVIDAAGRIEIARYNVRAKGHVASLRKALKITD